MPYQELRSRIYLRGSPPLQLVLDFSFSPRFGSPPLGDCHGPRRSWDALRARSTGARTFLSSIVVVQF